ncbi:MAG: tetratricopeptide repeat protein [Bacteroidales bacterium]|nr:tetratricopeptide repeat protein [Bacteroidales bacterium]
MKTIDFSYFIERYINSEMNEAEKEWFEKELKTNEQLRKEVILRKKTDEVLKNQEILDLRMKLNSIRQKDEANAPVGSTRKRPSLKYAAAVSILAVIGILALFTNRKMSTEELFDKYHKLYEPATEVRSGQSNIESDFATALEYYNVHDYRNAAIYFSKVTEKDPGNMHSTLLYGISSFENSNYPEAEKSFNRVIDDADNLYIDHAHWYLALCYLKTSEKDKAIGELNYIKKSTSLYSRDAAKILKRLR